MFKDLFNLQTDAGKLSGLCQCRGLLKYALCLAVGHSFLLYKFCFSCH